MIQSPHYALFSHQTILKGIAMRKPLPLLSVVIMFCVFILSGCWSEEEEEMMQAIHLLSILNARNVFEPVIFLNIDKERTGMTDEQARLVQTKIKESLIPFEEELQEKFGNFGDFKRDQLGDMVEAALKNLSRTNEITRQIIKETLPADVIKRLENDMFRGFGGVFGGALNAENLAPLDLTDEQREKAAQIVEKLDRERLELIFLLFMSIDKKAGEEPDLADVLGKFRELNEKVISITRRGQREIEALLTAEQKKRTEELMADVPERYRLLTDYLKNHPEN